MMRNSLGVTPKDIQHAIYSKFNIQVSYMKAWDAQRKAMKKLYGGWEDSYRNLYRYMEEIKNRMPGTQYLIMNSPENEFESLFWSFSVSIAGWQFCRPVVSLDGTFLTGKYRGTLLIAVGVDANNGIFPLAFGVVDCEREATWEWFLQCMVRKIRILQQRRDLCILSDKHAALLKYVPRVFPWATHRHCLRHLRENFKRSLRGIAGSAEDLCALMYTAGSTEDLQIHNQCMNNIHTINPDAHRWLIERDPVKWSLVYDGGNRYGAMTTNASESFNSVLKAARGLPIQALVSSTYYKLIGMFWTRREEAQKWNNFSMLTPRFSETLNVYTEEASKMALVTRVDTFEFEVVDRRNRTFRVDRVNELQCKCSCLLPEIYHMPCPHVIAAFASVRWSIKPFVSPYYTIQHYQNTYAAPFHTIFDDTNWPQFDEDRGIIPLKSPRNRPAPDRPQ